MDQRSIFGPFLSLMLLTLLVWTYLFARRIPFILKSKLTPEQFAARFGFSLDSIQNWEQGHRRPEGPARTLLAVIAKNPRAVEDAIRS